MNGDRQTGKAKCALQQYAELLRENNRQIQRLDQLEMRKNNDSCAEARALELAQSIRDGISLEQETGAKLEGLIGRLHSADERAVLRMRYFDLSGWPEIRSSLYGDKPDFLQREQSYSRRAFRLHTDALAALDQMLEDSGHTG